ncbi:Ig-like domain-containing protein [Jejudonia soesokkakensis]|uniref:Ig-like domain-containing protein n=1 Tax=Jejudonia soesokkakensis TaxID=1323432 RepID=A0ABW2MR89_9FLAO
MQLQVSQIKYLVLYLVLFLFLYSCKEDDDAYISLNIIVAEDFAQLSQNRFVDINVFVNDLNIPSEGILTTSEASQGVAMVIDPNNTPGNPSDDLIRYEANPNYTGEDSFTYTICNEEGTDCGTANVLISVSSSSTVAFNLSEMPYPKLSDYNFFEGDLADQSPNFGVIPYKPISSLFSDYAEKKRFVWMPNNVIATYEGDHEPLGFPVGSILIKAFYYNDVLPQNERRNIETRLMIRKETGWIFATYIWNDEQSEAFFDLSGETKEITWNLNGQTRNVSYRIPAESSCFTCHNTADVPIPIGLKPQNINSNYPYESGTQNQLEEFVRNGYLENTLPSNITTVVDWEDTSEPLDIRMRSYVDINCAHCHSAERYCNYRPLRFQFDLTEDDVNMGVCVDPDTAIPPYTKLVEPGNIDNSLVYFRLQTTLPQYRMPLLGRTLQHEEHLELVEQWIESLSNNCD